MREKIKRLLNEGDLGLVIFDSLSQAKVASLMTRLGMEYPGIRISSVPHAELARDLAGEAFKHDEVMDMTIKALSDANAPETEKMSRLPVQDVETWVREPDNVLFGSSRPGKIIWALLSDGRPAINALISTFVENFLQAVKDNARLEQRMEKKAGKLFSRRELKKLLYTVGSLTEELAAVRKDYQNASRENARLIERNEKEQQLVRQLRKEYGELVQEKGRWAQQIQKKEEELKTLGLKIKDLQNQMAVGPRFRLKSQVRHLEKENSRLNYLLEKQAQETRDKLAALERQVGEDRQVIADLRETNQKINQELHGQRSRFEELQKEHQLISARREIPPVPPKEKGRRLGIFIDNQNVYYSSKMHYGKKVDYARLLETLVKDRHLVKAMCYVVLQPEVSQEAFIAMLKNNGYGVRTRELIRRADGSAKGDWDIGIAADVMTMVEKNSLDVVVLVTCDGDFVDLVKLLSAKGVRVEVVGFPTNMAMDLKKSADEYYFITEELMV